RPGPAYTGDEFAQAGSTEAIGAGWATWALPVALAVGAAALLASASAGAIGTDPDSRTGRLLRFAARPFKRAFVFSASLVRRR
ncbi:hypothetical protein, partial [Glycomyces tenuis]|uniref:hypothetical protein n=1 Tax=Glycomyces tenuis TaxID=58116 RepID=UPI000551C3C7